MGRRSRNNGLTMTTFHPASHDCGRHAHQKANASALNFASQIAPPNCAVMFTKRGKSNPAIFTSRFACTSLFCHFIHRHALPLSKTKVFWLAHISPMVQRSPARWSSSGREPFGKTSGETSHVMAAHFPRNGRAVSTAMPPNIRQDDLQDNLPCAEYGRAMPASEVCETAPDMVVRQPNRSHAKAKATSHEWLTGILVIDF